MRGPAGRALGLPIEPFGEKLTQAGESTPHLEIGAPLDGVCPYVRAIGEPALLDSWRGDLEQFNGSSFRGFDLPSILLGRDPALTYRVVGRPEYLKGFWRANRLWPPEQRPDPFEHALNSTNRGGECPKLDRTN